MKVKTIKLLSFLVIFSTILFLYPVGKLLLTDSTTTKSLFIEQYYVKINSNQNEFDVFRNYMEASGWKEKEQLGGLHIFEKYGNKKQILNTDVKTIFIDGKLNI